MLQDSTELWDLTNILTKSKLPNTPPDSDTDNTFDRRVWTKTEP